MQNRISNYFILLFATFFFLHTSPILAELIHVPDDQETIQAGIDAAENGDTVLVHPGTYVENINFEGKAITVSSLIITMRDDAYIDSTIIDGNEEDCVVLFVNGEERNSILRGFTITNGVQEWGGGIDCQPNTGPTLMDLMVVENAAREGGGGIHCSTNATPLIIRVKLLSNRVTNTWGGGGLSSVWGACPVIRDSEFIGNIAPNGGALFCIDDGHFELDHVLIAGNEANYGGGIFIRNASGVSLTNTTIVDNRAGEGGGIFIHEFGISITTILHNSIIHNNDPSEIELDVLENNGGELVISYSDILEGLEGIIANFENHVDWQEGNIDEDPLFVDPENGDYHLTTDSPCINSGDPDSPEDPDGSRADMGAFVYLRRGEIQGLVLEAENDSPLEDATITTSYGFSTQSDSIGFWQFAVACRDTFDLVISKSGYNHAILTNLQADIEEPLIVDVRMLHPELVVSVEEFVETVPPNSSFGRSFTISNFGNGPLEWSGTRGLQDVYGIDPWQRRSSYPTGQVVDDNRLHGVVFTDNRFYVSGGAHDINRIYILNREGDPVSSYPQIGESRYGMKDLAWDGELIWGAVDETVYGFTVDGDSVTSFQGPFDQIAAITWDPDRELLWLSGITTNIHGYDRNGNHERVHEISRQGLRFYGLAYFPEDDAPLYVFTSPDVNRQVIHKIDPDIGDAIFVKELAPEEGGSAAGAFITDSFDQHGSWVFMNIANLRADDRIDIWQLKANTDWFAVDTSHGGIAPDCEQELELTFNTSGLD
ncbi:MAG: hypothetical protein HQ568_06565, partial [Calditrichaeota bacterium]|nr:hypothetical protein [Calditrichota bacterium]